MNKNLLRCLPAVISLVCSGAVSAAGFQLLEQNASGLGVAYAGSAAVAENASTVFYNPAGLMLLSGTPVSLGVAGVQPSYTFRDQGSSGVALGVGNGGDAGGLHAVPNAYFSRRINDDLAIGLGISAPFGLATEYDAGWLGAAQGIKSEIRTVNYNPSLAYRISDRVALGVGLNYQTIDGELSRTGVLMKGDDASLGWNAGLLFTLSPSMRLGLSYRSAVKHTLEGTINGALPIRADLKLPDTLTWSVWQQLSERWEVMGDLSYTRWGSLKQLEVFNRTTGAALPGEVFNYSNAWRLAWGAAYKANERLKIKFGIAYDRTPVKDSDRSVRVPDNDRLWLSFGGQWNTGGYGIIDLGYAYLYVKDPSLAQNRNGVNLVGAYDASAHLLGMQYSLGF